MFTDANDKDYVRAAKYKDEYSSQESLWC
jgi:hypothetical protein